MTSKSIHLNGGPKHDEYLQVPSNMTVVRVSRPPDPSKMYMTDNMDSLEFDKAISMVIGTYSEVNGAVTKEGIQEFEWDGWKI